MQQWEMTARPQMIALLWERSPYNDHYVVEPGGRSDWDKAERDVISGLVRSGHLTRAECYDGWVVCLTAKGWRLACHVLEWMDENL